MITTWRVRAMGALWSGLAALLAASPGVAAAAEGWAEIGWRWKWGEGSIIYNRDIAPVDLQDGGGTFRDSIGPFDILGWDMMTPVYFQGVGGTMTTRNGIRPGCPPEDLCDMISVRIDFAPLSNGDPAHWRLDMTAPGRLDRFGLPELGNGWEWNGPNFGGVLSNDLDDRRYGGPSEYFNSWNLTVAKPVPEPGSLALMALGLAGVGFAAQRWPKRAAWPRARNSSTT
jgi:hypothetical protein